MRFTHFVFCYFVAIISFGQTTSADKPYECGYVPVDFEAVEYFYNNTGKLLECQPGEIIASVGASSGYNEVALSYFVDNIEWTIQDIDSTCLNNENFSNVFTYHEKLNPKPIVGSFEVVLGTEMTTKLPRNTYDRILMINTYHELSNRESIVRDIHGALKENGVFVITEKMAKRPGKFRKDHKKEKVAALYEPDFLDELERFGFILDHKNLGFKDVIHFFVFRKG